MKVLIDNDLITKTLASLPSTDACRNMLIIRNKNILIAN